MSNIFTRLCCFLLAAHAAYAVPALVQKAPVSFNNGNPHTTSFSVLPTVGNTIIVLATKAFTTSITTLLCSDNQGNSYSLIQTVGALQGARIFAAHVGTSSGTFTITCSPGLLYVNIFAYEYSGLGTSGFALDSTCLNNMSNTCNLTTTKPNDLIIALFWDDNAGDSPGFTVGSGFTILDIQNTAGGGGPAATEYQIGSTATTYTVAMTWTSTSPQMVAAAFCADAGCVKTLTYVYSR